MPPWHNDLKMEDETQICYKTDEQQQHVHQRYFSSKKPAIAAPATPSPARMRVV